MYTSGASQAVSAWPNENEQGSKGSSSLIDVLNRWEQFFDHQVDSSEFINQLAGGDTAPLTEIEKGQRQLRQWLLIDLIRLPLDSQRQTVPAIERLLITQLNDLFDGFNRLLKTQPIAAKQLGQTIKLVQETLLGMERLYAGHFDVDQQLPLCLQAGYKTSIRQLFETCIIGKEEEIQNDLSGLHYLHKELSEVLYNESRPLTFRQHQYFQSLLARLSEPSITLENRQETFYIYNFNDPEFIEAECARLLQLIVNCTTTKHQIAALKWEQKRINQLATKPSMVFDPAMPSLLSQINKWIDEEVKYLDSGYAQLQPESVEGYSEKINTSLSVAKLAVLIRLLVIDKIIINRSAAPMLRVVAKTFTTLQKDDISYGSLETKYHAPDKAAVNNVRDMLFKWINILSKL